MEPVPANQAPTRWPGTSALDLEDLLDEVRARISVARKSQAQLAALLDSVVAISAGLELSEVLGRIVHSACALVDARYGALGVLGPDGEELVEFVTRGVTDEERARIGEPPRGHGLLGLLIHDPHPRRVRDITTHPDSYGFPPHHPPMHSFLGAPVRIREEIYGNLYMAEKQGAEEFTDDDEAMLVALAAAAGVAIDNARLYDRSQRQARWSEAIGELTQTLLKSSDEDTPVALMAAQAARLSGSQMAAVALFDESDQLVLRAVHTPRGNGGGETSESGGALELGRVLDGPDWEGVRQARQPLLLLSQPDEQPASGLAREVSDLAHVDPGGPTAVLPLALGSGDLGVLALAWSPGTRDVGPDVMPSLQEFAQLGGLAMIAARSQRDSARMALLEDRDRIARDMHDHVIQRLFATGLSLQSASRMAQHPAVRTRLDDAVDDLDAAIQDIRQTIFELHRPVRTGGLRGEIESLAEAFAETLGFDPELVIDGTLEALPSGLGADVVAVVREGLSNMSRHAKASHGAVHITLQGDVCVEISDDGVGVDASEARGGLVNLGERAAARSGSFVIRSAQPSGTVLTWRAPIAVD